MVAFALSVGAQSHLQLALEDFAGHDQGVGTGKTVDPFPVDSEAKVLYFTLDIDGNGVYEIFVSRSDLASGELWGLYSDRLDENGEIIKVGIVELAANGMRLAERDGVSGYYEYLHGGAGKGTLTFNSFDEDGNLMALWESVVDSSGKDKALMDSLHLGRFDSAARKPEVETVPLRPVWESHVKRKQAKLREQSVNQGTVVQAVPLTTTSREEVKQVDPPSVSAEISSRRWFRWIIIGIVTVFAFVAYRGRGPLRGVVAADLAIEAHLGGLSLV